MEKNIQKVHGGNALVDSVMMEILRLRTSDFSQDDPESYEIYVSDFQEWIDLRWSSLDHTKSVEFYRTTFERLKMIAQEYPSEFPRD